MPAFKTSLIPAIILLAAVASSSLGLAHHSQAMFDTSRRLTLSGTVREFQFSNPHCYIQVLVPVPGETSTIEWSVEMGAPTHLLRAGIYPDTLKPGEKITVVIIPLRDGGKGGHYVSATGPDGKRIGLQL
jgi:hypothetical protein